MQGACKVPSEAKQYKGLPSQTLSLGKAKRFTRSITLGECLGFAETEGPRRRPLITDAYLEATLSEWTAASNAAGGLFQQPRQKSVPNPMNTRTGQSSLRKP